MKCVTNVEFFQGAGTVGDSHLVHVVRSVDNLVEDEQDLYIVNHDHKDIRRGTYLPVDQGETFERALNSRFSTTKWH